MSSFSNQAGQLTEVKVDGGVLVEGDGAADFASHVETVVKLAAADFLM